MEALRGLGSSERAVTLSQSSGPDYAAIGEAVRLQVCKVIGEVQRYTDPQEMLHVCNEQIVPIMWRRGYFRVNGVQVNLFSDRDGSCMWVVMTDAELEFEKTFVLVDGELDADALDYLAMAYGPVLMRYDRDKTAKALALFAQVVKIHLDLMLPATITAQHLPPCELGVNGRAVINGVRYEVQQDSHGMRLLVGAGLNSVRYGLTDKGMLTADSAILLRCLLQNRTPLIAEPTS